MTAPKPLSSEELTLTREWFPKIAKESDHVWLLQRNRTLRLVDALFATIDAQAATIRELQEAYEAVKAR